MQMRGREEEVEEPDVIVKLFMALDKYTVEYAIPN